MTSSSYLDLTEQLNPIILPLYDQSIDPDGVYYYDCSFMLPFTPPTPDDDPSLFQCQCPLTLEERSRSYQVSFRGYRIFPPSTAGFLSLQEPAGHCAPAKLTYEIRLWPTQPGDPDPIHFASGKDLTLVPPMDSNPEAGHSARESASCKLHVHDLARLRGNSDGTDCQALQVSAKGKPNELATGKYMSSNSHFN